MKNIVTLLLLSLITIGTYAQLPKGDRIFAWQVDMAQNNNYDSAYAYAQTGCMESIHLFFTWSSIEINNGNFDASYIANTLDIIDIYHPAYGNKAELQIATINTVAKETPSDLLTVDFDNPIMINRFKGFLDTLFTHIPNLELTALNIGNEHDIFMGTDAIQYTQYKTFLDSVIPYAKQLYFNLHGTDLKVGTTFTFDGLTSASTSTLCKGVNDSLDIVTLTYYPLNPDFTMEAPSIVSSDFTNLISIYSDTLQPIYFAECGYASSDSCNSSDLQQAQFFQNIFTSWDTYYDNIKYLTIFKTTDWSQQEVNDFAIYYGISDNIFLEYLRTLGVRTWDNDGTSKPAYETILCELNARGWCSVNCITTGIYENIDINNVKVYPNPTNGLININTEKLIEQVKVYNSLGKLCLVTNNAQININKLPNGIYYLTIQFKTGGIERKKLIKQ
ncbi:T9SS type A sorting domain-containing protein [Flavobacteriales bacterium]|nr:T9SS type A sorting domain-containing protein [Flavobacteriales bacterium]